MENCKKGCCTTELHSHGHDDHHGHHHDHDHDHGNTSSKEIIITALAFIILMSGIIIEYVNENFFSSLYIELLWYGIPFLFVGLPVWKSAFDLMKQKDFFNELSLMSLATMGAFAINEYAEGLGVMVFYTIGELIQHHAVSKSKKNIKALLDVRPSIANIVQNNSIISIDPKDVQINDIIEVRTGEKVPLDGILLTEHSFFNTAALTGESVPRHIKKTEEVLAGMLSSEKTVRIQVSKLYENSTLARILQMVQDAVKNKSVTELFIRKFARYYTPIVFFLALSVIIIPFFILGNDYIIKDWVYRSLVFLVLSCPCALVISVPLGYFGGIGLASSNGILFKGSNYLEAMTNLSHLVTDKTGTMTKGVFTIQNVITDDKTLLLTYLSSIEKHSTHPIAKAIVEYGQAHNYDIIELENVKDIPGKGLEGYSQEKKILAGSYKLMNDHHISIPSEYLSFKETVTFLAINNQLIGLVTIADEIKEDASLAVANLHKLHISTTMLSGDKKEIVHHIAKQLSIDEAHGDLLPEDKANFVRSLKEKQDNNAVIAFVGDGINDAPVLALSDIGIAMGGLGSDLAIETADIIIQTDEPSKIPLAVYIAKDTRFVVIQNIILAMITKVIVLILGVYGLATIWEAIFADVGVSLLAILNASRLLYKKYNI